ncbi:hypothetical protein BH11PLA2_BH11PLA2_21830 [soil metagenome]
MAASQTFKPSVHGFPFPNWYPPGTPVISVRTPFGTILLGDANGGVCGGMVFAAADLFHHAAEVPREPLPTVFKYFCTRLLDSWQLPFGAFKYYDWQRRPTASRTWTGVKLVDGTSYLTLTFEWPKVRARLDAGLLAPLGLVKAHGLDPRHMGHHHQVLAYAYEMNGEAVTLRVYDPNYPGDDACTLSFVTTNPDRANLITHSCEGPSIRGMFSVEYVPREVTF